MTATTMPGNTRAPDAAGADPLLVAPILPTMLRLAAPNMLAMLAIALVAIAETAYVGRLGTPQLAGMALVFPLIMLQQMMSAGAMGGGISSAVARALGARDEARAATLARHAVLIGAVAGIAMSAVFLFAGEAIYRLLGGRGAALEQALAYSNVVAFAVANIWLTNTLASIIRGGGGMRVPSVTLLGSAATQVIAGGVLGLGLGPFPRLGMAGIAAGQVIAFVASTLFLFWYLISGRARVRLGGLRAGFSWDMFRDILKVGAVACIMPLQTVLTILALTRLVSRFGTEALAGYGIGSRLEFLLVPITFAIGVACVPMVGMAIGAGDVARARRVAWIGGGLAATLTGAAGLLVAIFPQLWAGLFSSDPAVLASSAAYLRWAGPCFGCLGLAICLYFASLGAGKMLGPVLAGTVRLAVIICGGWWLAASGAPASAMFVLVGASMVIFGMAAALAIYAVAWDPKG